MELKERLNEALLTDPVLQAVLGGLVLMALLCGAVLTGSLIYLGTKGRLRFNRVPALRLPVWGQAAAYVALALLCFTIQSKSTGDLAMLLQVLIAPAALLVVALTPPGMSERYGVNKLSLPLLPVLGVVILFASFVLIQPVGLVSNLILQALGFDIGMQSPVNKLFEIDNPERLTNLVFLAVVIAPVMEEILFRGFLHPMLKSVLPTWGAVIVTSLVFAAFHFHAPVFAQLFVLALIISVAYEITGSFGLCILIHMLFNALQAGLALFLRFWILA